MKNNFKENRIYRFFPFNTFVFCVGIWFIIVLFVSADKSSFKEKIFYITDIFYQNEFFLFTGVGAIALLLMRSLVIIGIPNKLESWVQNRKRKLKKWPTLEEEILLESLFYEGINFYELNKFVQWAYDISYIAYTENNNATLKGYTLLARDETEKYWYSYFRLLYREPGRIRMLSPLVSHFIAVLTDDAVYREELKEQSKLDPELHNVDTRQLLVAILDKEKTRKYYDLCYKYYKMLIEKRVEKETL